MSIATPQQVRDLGTRAVNVCDLLLEGRSEKEIAVSLEISAHTVHAHIKRIYRTVGVNSQRQLAALVISRLQARIDEIEARASTPTLPDESDNRDEGRSNGNVIDETRITTNI